MNSFNVGSALYATKSRDILSMGVANQKQVGMKGPSYMGLSQYRPADASKQVKYGSQSLFIDKMLVHNTINALEGTDATGKAVVYMEYSGSQGKYRAVYDGDLIRWESNIPTNNSTKILPVILFAISKNSNLTEAKDAFIKCVNDFYSPTAMVAQVNMLLFNDSLYYGYCKDKIIGEDDSLDINEIKRSISMGLLQPMEILVNNVKTLMPLEVSVSQNTPVSKVPKKDQNIEIYEKCLRGEYMISYPWTDKQKNKIPNIKKLENYIPSDKFYSVLNKVNYRINKIITRLDANITGIDAICDDYINIYTVGRPGTGKTTLANMIGAATGIPVYPVNMDKNVDDNEFEGKTKIVNGTFNFVETGFLEAYTNGGIIILEEINLADPNVIMGTLGQAIEPPFILKRNGFEEVRRHPLCIIIHTMNVGTVGSRAISEAYADRSKQVYVLDDTKKQDFINILMQKGYKKNACEWVYEAYTRIQTYLKDPHEPRDEFLLLVGIRGAIGALQNMEEGDDPKLALENSLVGKIALVDLELYNDLLKNVVNNMPDLVY